MNLASPEYAPPAREDEPYRSELLGIMQADIDSHPRSSQKQIGPSEVGSCERQVAWKLLYGGSSDKPGGFAAHRGTLFHEWLDDTFKGVDRFMPDGSQRFFSDLKLNAVSRSVAGGTLDLYDALIQRVTDWKAPGDWSMDKVRAGNLSWGYYIQSQVYALHLQEHTDHPVRSTALFFLPACGDDLHSIRKGAVLRWWPYDREVALEALKKVERIQRMIDSGAQAQKILEIMPVKSSFCSGCPAFAGNGDRRAMCPGASSGRSGKTVDSDKNPFAR